MPYVPEAAALNQPAVRIAEIRSQLGPGPWRQPIVGLDVLRAVLIAWEPGYASVPHVHPRAVEVFHVLEGSAAFRIGHDVERIVGPGTVLLAPPAVWHQIRVVGRQDLLLMVTLAPNEDASDETIEQQDRAGRASPR